MTTFVHRLALASVLIVLITLPVSAQTLVSVIFTTPVKYYASLHDYASPEAVSRSGQIEAGMHLCVANQLIRYRDTKLVQLFLPNGQVVYVDYAEAWGSYDLDPANDKKCQAQYARLSGSPVQKNTGRLGATGQAMDGNSNTIVVDGVSFSRATVDKLFAHYKEYFFKDKDSAFRGDATGSENAAKEALSFALAAAAKDIKTKERSKK